MRSERMQLILTRLYDLMLGAGMILATSVGVTLAISIPFMAFGGLHALFCK